MIKVYPAVFHHDSDGIWVEFPDVPGCTTCGATIEETMDLAQEALGLHLATLIEEKLPVPEATNIASMEKGENEFLSYVYTDVEKYFRNTKAVKKTLSIPAWLAEAAEEKHLSLSKILQEGLKSRLGV